MPPPVSNTGTAENAAADARRVAATDRGDAMRVIRLLQLLGILAVVAGGLLPFYLAVGDNGIGRSAWDAAISPKTPASILLLIAGLALTAAVVSIVLEWFALGSERVRRPKLRGILELLALVAVGVAALLVIGGDTGLGQPHGERYLNTAVWVLLIGLAVLVGSDLLRGVLLGRMRRSALLAFTITLAILFPQIFSRSTDLVVWGAQFAAIFILLALGLNVVVGFAGLLDLGYAAFFAIGAYVTGSLGSGVHDIHLPFWVLIFIGAAVASLFGAVLGAPTLRLRGDYLAIVTLGFGEIVPDLALNNVFGLTGGPNGLSSIDPPTLFTHAKPIYDFGLIGSNPGPYFYTLLVLIVMVVVLLRNVEKSRLGRAWIAIREDEVAAAATGINTVTTKLLAFAIGASISGFAGAFYGAIVSAITPEAFSFQVSVTALSTVVLGGIGNIAGVTVGAIVITFVIYWILPHLQGWMQTVGTTVHTDKLAAIDYSQYKYIVYGVILIAIMLLRPGGLLPSRSRKVELQSGKESEPLASVQETA